MKRREFITGSAARQWCGHSRRAAQQSERMRRIGVFFAGAADANDADTRSRLAAFQHGLQQLGWSDGRNIQIDYRFGGGNAALIRKYAEELVALSPDVIFSSGAATVAPLLQVTRTVPIVFAGVVDPVGAGFVDNLARPGGNATGFILFEYSLGGKWLELLKQIAPGVTRAAVIRDAALSAGTGQFGAVPVSGAVARGGGEPDQPARRPGDRASHRHIRALLERRPNRYVERIDGALIAI